MTPARPKRILALGIAIFATCFALLAIAAAAKAAPPHNNVPVQPSFVQAPWVYDWQTTYTYKLQLVNTTDQTMYGRVHFSSVLLSKQKGGGGGDVSRDYTVKPGATKIITVRFMTPLAQAEGNFYSWCVGADIYAEGMDIQSVVTCASYDTGK